MFVEEQTATGSNAVEMNTSTNEQKACLFGRGRSAAFVTTTGAGAAFFAEQRATVPDAVEYFQLQRCFP